VSDSKLKKHIIILGLILSALVGGLAYSLAESFYQAEFMPIARAEKKWGIKTLDKDRFRSGDPSQRAAMAVDIIKRSLFVGKSRKLVRQELGDPDSYFFSDTIYAYKIMPFPGAKMENWHLVFIPDEKLEMIKEVKIHKKCCYKSLIN
jgi:hypothetical protein